MLLYDGPYCFRLQSSRGGCFSQRPLCISYLAGLIETRSSHCLLSDVDPELFAPLQLSYWPRDFQSIQTVSFSSTCSPDMISIMLQCSQNLHLSNVLGTLESNWGFLKHGWVDVGFCTSLITSMISFNTNLQGSSSIALGSLWHEPVYLVLTESDSA